MPLKLALIVVAPLALSSILFLVAGVPWSIAGRILAVLTAFLLITGLCDLARRRSRTHRDTANAATTGQRHGPAAEQVLAAAGVGAIIPHHGGAGVRPREQHAAAAGLGAAAIAGLPTYRYEKRRCGGGGGEDECAVCLGEVRPREVVKRLPACTHLFHRECIDVWLDSHVTCPVCRSPVAVDAVVLVPAMDVAAVRVQS